MQILNNINTFRYYRPELDLLRLIAFLFIFFSSGMDLASIDPGMFYWQHQISLVGVFGVPLCFLLSAFLITELLGREQELFGKICLRSFYIRRMLRIWPLYFVFFLLIVLLANLSHLFGPKIPAGAQLAFGLFFGNWYITFNEWISYCIDPLWSISVEVQFCILLPLVMFYFGKAGLKIFSFLVIIVGYLTVIYYAQHPTRGFSGEWTNSFIHFQFFAAGILLSIYLKEHQPFWPAWTRLFFFLTGVGSWLVASIVCKVHADVPHVSNVIQAVSGWGLLLVGVMFLFLSFYGISLSYIPWGLAYLGRISYGMYVFHVIMLWLVYVIFDDKLAAFAKQLGFSEWQNTIGFIIALIATVLISILSYQFFEKPFLCIKKQFTLIPSRN